MNMLNEKIKLSLIWQICAEFMHKTHFGYLRILKKRDKNFIIAIANLGKVRYNGFE